MKENPSYDEWIKATPEERGDLWLYQPLYKKPYESWDKFGRKPGVKDFLQAAGQLTLGMIRYALDIRLSSQKTSPDISQRHDVDI
jgi:hypothetical protein